MHLAQLNIGRVRYPVEDPRMAGFTGNIAAVNALADRSDGFIWRLADDSDLDGALDLRLPGADDVLVNMSVWRDLESLFQFVYKTVHAKIMRDRNEYFVPPNAPFLVLWWVDEGHVPSLVDARDRLERLRKHGPAPDAFSFDTPFDAAGRPVSPKFPKKDCA